jgi:hypothetical protein
LAFTSHPAAPLHPARPAASSFSNWPEWLKVLVLVTLGILASVAYWLWWPKPEKGYRRFGFCGGVPTGVLSDHALRLSNEGFQVVNAHDRHTQASAHEDDE